MRAFQSEKIPRPAMDWPANLLDTALDLEIGAGQGLHAIRYCQLNPKRQLLAVERTHTKFARLERRKSAHPELTHLHTLHADAVAVAAHFLGEQSLDRIFLLYPNPYPKAKQANLRWHNSSFMGFLKSRLKSKGELQLATNLQWYALEARTMMQEAWGFELLCERTLRQGQIEPRTHFEKKYLERGDAVYDLIFSPGPV